MNCTIISSVAAALIIISCAGLTTAQWTPDPFCPFPSDHVTRYPYYGNCSIYWECYNGAKYVMECPEGLEFNAPYQRCDAPEIAKCDPFASTTANPNPPTYTTGPTGRTTSSNGPDPMCPYPSEDLVYFSYPGDCTKYWECFEGNKYLYTCPAGLWWHEEISECDYPGPFCDNSTTVSPPTTASTGPTTSSKPTAAPGPDPICPFPSEELIYFPYPGDCTKYWECFEGKKYLYNCPAGLWWHEEISECDYPGPFCDNTTTIAPPTTHGPTTSGPNPTAGPKPVCPNPPTEEPVYFPYAGDCTKYWECSDGKEYEYTCPSGLWWHQEITQCDYPGSFCDNTTTIAPPTRPPTTSSPAPTTAPKPVCPDPPTEEPVYFPYAGDCTKYWECSDGKEYEYTCPSGLWWHQEIKQCDYPGSFCDDSSTVNPPTRQPTTVGPTTDAPPIFVCNGTSTSYWPHPSDCHRYIECLEGIAYVVDCPVNLYFSDNLKECVVDTKSECCKVHQC